MEKQIQGGLDAGLENLDAGVNAGVAKIQGLFASSTVTSTEDQPAASFDKGMYQANREGKSSSRTPKTAKKIEAMAKYKESKRTPGAGEYNNELRDGFDHINDKPPVKGGTFAHGVQRMPGHGDNYTKDNSFMREDDPHSNKEVTAMKQANVHGTMNRQKRELKEVKLRNKPSPTSEAGEGGHGTKAGKATDVQPTTSGFATDAAPGDYGYCDPGSIESKAESRKHLAKKGTGFFANKTELDRGSWMGDGGVTANATIADTSHGFANSVKVTGGYTQTSTWAKGERPMGGKLHNGMAIQNTSSTNPLQPAEREWKDPNSLEEQARKMKEEAAKGKGKKGGTMGGGKRDVSGGSTKTDEAAFDPLAALFAAEAQAVVHGKYCPCDKCRLMYDPPHKCENIS